MGRKDCGKKEKMLVSSIFSFSHNVFKRLLFQGRQKLGLCGKELTHYQLTNYLFCPGQKHLQLTNKISLK